MLLPPLSPCCWCACACRNPKRNFPCPSHPPSHQLSRDRNNGTCTRDIAADVCTSSRWWCGSSDDAGRHRSTWSGRPRHVALKERGRRATQASACSLQASACSQRAVSGSQAGCRLRAVSSRSIFASRLAFHRHYSCRRSSLSLSSKTSALKPLICAVAMSQIDEELKTVRKLLSRRDGPTSDFNGDPLDPLEAGPLNPTDSTLLHVIAPGHTLPRCFSTPPECLRRHFRKQT